MKKFSIIALALVLTLSLAACGKKNNETTTPTTTQPSTDMTVFPDIDPTFETNIPDPNVDTSMPMYTDGTNSTDSTDNTDTTDSANSRSRRGY